MTSKEEKKYLKTASNGKGKTSTDWFDRTVNGASIILTAVRDASGLAPVPYLQQAAGTTLSIIQTVQTVKDNRQDLQQLAEDAAKLIAAIYQAYLQSNEKEGWPGEHLQESLKDLISSLQDIERIADARSKRRLPGRFINSITDTRKIQEYRTRLDHALQVFGVSAQLQAYEILRKLDKRSDAQVSQAQHTEVAAIRQREEKETELKGLEDENRREDAEAAIHVRSIHSDIAREKKELEKERESARLRNEELERKRVEMENAREQEENARRRRLEIEEHQREIRRLREEREALERRRRADEERQRRGMLEVPDHEDHSHYRQSRLTASPPAQSTHQGGVSFFNGASNVSISGNSSFNVTTR